MEKVKLRFYQIDRCGYYERNSDKVALSSVEETLDEIKDWLVDKTLEKTKTTSSSKVKTDRLPVYCTGLKKGTKSYIMTTWNQTESTKSGVSSIPLSEPLTSLSEKVEIKKLSKGYIPGYATYFWFIPEDNIMATIRLNHVENGHVGLDAYIKGYLSRYSKFRIVKKDPLDKLKINIIGYGNSKTDFKNNIYPQFNTRPKRLKGNTDYIHTNINQITKIIRKCSIDQTKDKDSGLLRSLGNTLGFTKPQKSDEPLELKFELKTKPTIQEVNDIIKKWNEKITHDNWDDIGFKLKGRDNPIWLSTEIPTKDLNIHIKRDNEEFIDEVHLIKILEELLPDIKDVYKGK